MARQAEVSRSVAVGALIETSLQFLRGMQLEDSAFCLERARGDGAPRSRSLRYTAMCFIGLSKAAQNGYSHDFDLGAIGKVLSAGVGSPDLRPGDYGLLLWANAAGGIEGSADELLARAVGAVDDEGVSGFEGQELAWIVIGLLKNSAARNSEDGARILRRALDELLARCDPSSGLLYHYGRPHHRRRFANFATQAYGLLALSLAAGQSSDLGSLLPARRLGERLVALQLPDGGWPWLYDVERGTVVEPYEIYSVHQHGMGPMGLLELANASGDDAFRNAALRGLDWIHGNNELGLVMVDEHATLIYRSIRRCRPLDRAALYVSAAASLFGASLRVPGPVELNPTCRPYELGWLIEAWSGREA